ncbi:hypothetical protein HY345_04330 [Candidatus Microgenomates bacterium]|nr:hypothetical protein [Candidatus Microgenomates bacterium]
MILLHGDDTEKSRAHLSKIKQDYEEIVTLDGKNLQQSDLLQALEGASLFGDKKLVIVEGLFSKKKEEQIFIYLKNNSFPNLVLWEGKEITKRDQMLLGSKFSVYSYKLPALIFKFVDLVGTGKIKEALVIYDELLEQVAPEVLWFMLVRQWRFMLLAKKTDEEEPSDFQRLQVWQKAKLTQNGKAYTLDKLKAFYRQLLRISYREKSGAANLPLEKQLEMLLLFELSK